MARNSTARASGAALLLLMAVLCVAPALARKQPRQPFDAPVDPLGLSGREVSNAAGSTRKHQPTLWLIRGGGARGGWVFCPKGKLPSQCVGATARAKATRFEVLAHKHDASTTYMFRQANTSNCAEFIRDDGILGFIDGPNLKMNKCNYTKGGQEWLYEYYPPGKNTFLSTGVYQMSYEGVGKAIGNELACDPDDNSRCFFSVIKA